MEDAVVEESYEAFAKDRLTVLQCQKKGLRKYSELSAQGVIDAIKSAKSPNRVAELISCDFRVGQNETDYTWYPIPSQVAPVIYKRLQSLKLTDLKPSYSSEQRELIQIKNEKDDSYDGFCFDKRLGRWTWTCFVTGSAVVLKNLEHPKNSR